MEPVTIIRGKDNYEELEPLFSVYRDKEGKLYATGDNPKFCISDNNIDALFNKVERMKEKYREWKADDGA